MSVRPAWATEQEPVTRKETWGPGRTWFSLTSLPPNTFQNLLSRTIEGHRAWLFVQMMTGRTGDTRVPEVSGAPGTLLDAQRWGQKVVTQWSLWPAPAMGFADRVGVS